MTRSLMMAMALGLLGACLAPSTASACHKKKSCHQPTCETVVVVEVPCPPPVVHCPPPPPPCPPPAPVCDEPCAPKAKGCGHMRLFAKNKPCKKCHPAPKHEVVYAHCTTPAPVVHTYYSAPVTYAAPQSVTPAPQAPVAAPQSPTKTPPVPTK